MFVSVLSIVCVLQTGGTMAAPAQDWWEHSVFYQIYPLSFQDSNGDGVGDLQGIKQRLPYLKETGIKATWLSPIFDSPLKDFGYDISNFRKIQPQYGTLDDFDELIAEAKKQDIKIILDFVPNHTSDQHEWFIESAAKNLEFDNYYIWHDGTVDEDGTRQPPNNWRSVFSGSAWTFHEGRGQFYFHQFLKEQPDLNYRNPKVVQEMKDVMTFWLDRGAAGFRVDAIPHLFEDAELPDEPLSHNPEALSTDYAYLKHPHSFDLPETFDMVYQWRQHLDEYSRSTDNITRVMMTEAYSSIKNQMLYYGNGERKGAHFTFNFLMITELDKNSTAHDFTFCINKWLSYMPLKNTANWVLGNHDNKRVASRYGPEKADGLNMLLMVLPGVAVTYYGEEIGMEDTQISFADTKDPSGLNVGEERYLKFSRDPERTPMQWNDTVNAGFSEAEKTWLPVNENYPKLNLKLQQQTENSHYRIYKDLIALRETVTLKYGELRIKSLSIDLFSLAREFDGEPTYVLIFNLGSGTETMDLSPYRFKVDTAEVVIASGMAEYEKGEVIAIRNVPIGPYAAYVLKLG